MAMADDGRFFDDSDPEWAVARLTVGPAGGRARLRGRLRSAPWVAGLAAFAGVAAVLLAVVPRDDRAIAPVAALTAPAATRSTPEPLPVRPAVAPRATLSAIPLRAKPLPAPPPRTYASSSPSPAVTVAPAPAAKPHPKPHRPSRPANQVGPNRPLKSPWSPLDP